MHIYNLLTYNIWCMQAIHIRQNLTVYSSSIAKYRLHNIPKSTVSYLICRFPEYSYVDESVVKDSLILSYIPTCMTHTHVLRTAEHKTHHKRCLIIYTGNYTLHYNVRPHGPCITSARAIHRMNFELHLADGASLWALRPKDLARG